MISENFQEKFERFLDSKVAYEVVVFALAIIITGAFALCMVALTYIKGNEEISSHDYEYVFGVSEKYHDVVPVVRRAISDDKITRREFREIVGTVSEITSRERIDQIKDVVREGAGL